MDKPRIIGVTGGSGSGKTRFIEELVKKMPGVAVHSMDNYYIKRELQPRDVDGEVNYDTLESIDTEKYVEDLKLLIKGETLQLEEYQYNNSSAEKRTIEIQSADVILVEGIFALYLEGVREQLDLKVFVEVPSFLMMKRRIIRDAEERGYDLNDVLYRYEHHVMPSYKKYIEPSKKWADLIIPNYDNFDVALDVVTTFLNR